MDELLLEIENYFSPLFTYSEFSIQNNSIRMYGEFNNVNNKFKVSYYFSIEQLSVLSFPKEEAFKYIQEKLKIPDNRKSYLTNRNNCPCCNKLYLPEEREGRFVGYDSRHKCTPSIPIIKF